MVRVFSVLLLVFFAALGSCSVAKDKQRLDYVTSQLNGKTYYHLMYSLSAEAILSLDELSKTEFYDNGGQFEVRIDKALFPVRSPNCKSSIILRMPWVGGGATDGSLDAKYAMYRQLVALDKNESSAAVDLAIELNPYINFDDKGIYLTHCNVFFRHADGKYIPYVQ